MNGRTVLIVVLDAMGIPTLNRAFDAYDGPICLPNLARMGLGRLPGFHHNSRLGFNGEITAHVEAINQVSRDADSLIGHWEAVGIRNMRHYPLFDKGLPLEFVQALEKAIGHKVMLNKMGGGDEVVGLYGDEHLASGELILYMSICDPLAQLAMHLDLAPIEEQIEIAEIGLKLAREHGINMTRFIARPFKTDDEGKHVRVAKLRHDATMPLPGPTLINILHEQGVHTVAVGKIAGLIKGPYDERIKLKYREQLDPALGHRFVHPRDKDSNPYTSQGIFNALNAARSTHRPNGTVIVANEVDFDAVHGHPYPWDVKGTMENLMEVDHKLGMMRALMKKGDAMGVMADHGILHKKVPNTKKWYGFHEREPLPFMFDHIGYDGIEHVSTFKCDGLARVGMFASGILGCQDQFKEIITEIPAD